MEVKRTEKKNTKQTQVNSSNTPIHHLEVLFVYAVVQFLTGSARLFGDRQGDLGEWKDVNLGAILGGRRGQGGEICLVLLSLCVFKLLAQRNTLGLVIHSQSSFHWNSGRQWFNCEDIQMHWGTSTYPYTLVMYIVGCIVWDAVGEHINACHYSNRIHKACLYFLPPVYLLSYTAEHQKHNSYFQVLFFIHRERNFVVEYILSHRDLF